MVALTALIFGFIAFMISGSMGGRGGF